MGDEPNLITAVSKKGFVNYIAKQADEMRN